MPMAGEGSRFANAGWSIPKPLIEFHGLPHFKHAISSVVSDGIEMKYSFIVRNEHILKYDRLIKYGLEGQRFVNQNYNWHNTVEKSISILKQDKLSLG